MALTRSFDQTVKNRMRRDPAFRIGLLWEATKALLGGEFTLAMILLRDQTRAFRS